MYCEIALMGPRGRVAHPFACMDTGFAGFLKLNPETIAELELVWSDTAITRLADGSLQRRDVFDVEIDWFGQMHSVKAVEVPGRPLIGMELLRGCELRATVEPDGGFEITPIERETARP